MNRVGTFIRRKKKLPKGGKRTPWLYVPTHHDGESLQHEYFLYLGRDYTFRTEDRGELPKDAFVIRMAAF